MISSKLKKTNSPGFSKDTKSGAVINTDQQQLAAFQLVREKAKRDSLLGQRVDAMEIELNTLKEQISKLTERRGRKKVIQPQGT